MDVILGIVPPKHRSVLDGRGAEPPSCMVPAVVDALSPRTGFDLG
jgi:hypothetical protein